MALTDDDKAFMKGLVNEARGILREDKILQKLNKAYPEESTEGGPSDSGNDNSEGGSGPGTPPKKDHPNEPSQAPRRARWWPDESNAGNGGNDEK